MDRLVIVIILALAGCIDAASGQWAVIGRQLVQVKESPPFVERLRNDPPPTPIRVAPRPRPRYTARPGNVVVHFDRDHEIQQLQYVLQDGQLATLYRRNAVGSENMGQPVQVWAQEQLYRRDDTPTAGPATSSNTVVTHSEESSEHVIEIQNAQHQPVSHIVGDSHVIPVSGLNGHDRMAILATIAADTLHTGVKVAGPKLKKLGHAMGGIRDRIGKKLGELPALVEKKLREKSTSGQVFVDSAGHQVPVSGLLLQNGQRVSLTELLNSKGPQFKPIQAQAQKEISPLELSQQQLRAE